MNPTEHQFIEEHSLLGPSHRVEAILGAGAFGVVAKCRNINTNERVAIKVNKPSPGVFHQAREEIENLKRLRCLNPDTSCIINWQGFFFHKDNICLTFELLDLSLNDYMRYRQRPGLPLTEVKSVLKQMSTALSHLSSMGIVHTDIKPDNIMVVDRNEEPIKVKLIDFGLSFLVSARQPGVRAGTLWYMAPEMTLECSFNEAIDMWSLGQTAVETVTGYPMYPGNTAYDVMRFIVETQGQPEDHVLDQGQATVDYFIPQRNGPSRWKFGSPEDSDYAPEETRWYILESLDGLKMMMDHYRGHHRDHHLFVDLIKRMLSLDPEQRIKPLEVLQHPFLSESLPQSSFADTINDSNNVEEAMREEDQQLSENQTARPAKKELRIKTEIILKAKEPEDGDIRNQTGDTSSVEKPDNELRIQTESTSHTKGPEDKDFEIKTGNTSSTEEPEVELRIQTESSSQAEELESQDFRIQTEATSLAEEQEVEDIWIRKETASPAEGPEVERSVEEEIQPETRTKKAGLFRRVFKYICNAFRTSRRSRRRSRSPLETSV